MNIFQISKLRLLNGRCLDYTLYGFVKLVLLKSILSKFNKHRHIKCDSFISLNLTNILIEVISLPFRIDRRRRIESLLSHNELNFRFVDAINGSEIRQYSDLSKFTSAALKYLSEGSIGCILSHHKALVVFRNSSYDYCLILEDDVIINGDFNKNLEKILTKIPADFDILYLGSSNSPTKNLDGWINARLFVPMYPRMGQYSYLVSRKGAIKIMENIFPVKIVLGGIDTIIGRMVSKGYIVSCHTFPNAIDIDRTISSNIYNPSTPKKIINQNK